MHSFPFSQLAHSVQRLYKRLTISDEYIPLGEGLTLLKQLQSNAHEVAVVHVTEMRAMYVAALPDVHDARVRKADLCKVLNTRAEHEYVILSIYRPDNFEEPYGFLKYERTAPNIPRVTYAFDASTILSANSSTSSPGGTSQAVADNILSLTRTASDSSLFRAALGTFYFYNHDKRPSDKYSRKPILTLEGLDWKLAEVIAACEAITSKFPDYSLATSQCYLDAQLMLYLLLETPLGAEGNSGAPPPSDIPQLAVAHTPASISSSNPLQPQPSTVASPDMAPPCNQGPSWIDFVNQSKKMGTCKSCRVIHSTEVETKGKAIQEEFRNKYRKLEEQRLEMVDMRNAPARAEAAAILVAEAEERTAKAKERIAQAKERTAKAEERAQEAQDKLTAFMNSAAWKKFQELENTAAASASSS